MLKNLIASETLLPSPFKNFSPRLSRREFLALSGSVVTWYLTEQTFPRLRQRNLAAERLTEWPPNLSDLVEWRFVAGRIVEGAQDFGFVISISSIRVPGSTSQELFVQRQDFSNQQEYASQTYAGTLTYEPISATYTFQDETNQELITWQWDETAQVYHLTLTTAELTLTNLVLRPQGELIPEGGDGQILVGRFQGILIASDYHADWTEIEIDGQVKGTARLDIQGLRPSLTSSTARQKSSHWLKERDYSSRTVQQEVPITKARSANEKNDDDYDHHWFALAVELEDGSSAWISGWRIEDVGGPFWAVTIARGQGPSWEIALSLTEESGLDPLEVTTLAWQDIPPEIVTAQNRSRVGRKWRLALPTETIDLEIAVPPGQFLANPPQSGLGGQLWMEEGVGLEATGTVLGKSISSVKVALAESTAEFYLNFIPIIHKS